MTSEQTAYIVCKLENKDRSVIVLVVPEADADWLAAGMGKVPETFNTITVIKKPSLRSGRSPV